MANRYAWEISAFTTALFAAAITIILRPSAVSAQSESSDAWWIGRSWEVRQGEAEFSPTIKVELEARPQAAVTTEEESSLMSKGFVEIGTVHIFLPVKKSREDKYVKKELEETATLEKETEAGGDRAKSSTEELAKKLEETAVLEEAALHGGDLVRFLKDGEVERKAVSVKGTARFCTQSHSTITPIYVAGCSWCSQGTRVSTVCTGWTAEPTLDWKNLAFVVSEGTVWRLDPTLAAPETTLFLAASRGEKGMVEALLAKGSDVNAKEKLGVTPLHVAAFGGYTDVVQVLLAHGADVNAKDYKNWTPLKWAEIGRHKDTAELLRQHGGHK